MRGKKFRQNRFLSRSMAYAVAAIMKRMTGDKTQVVTHVSDSRHLSYRVVRTDPSGKEFDA